MKINWNKKYTTYAIYAALICAAIIFCIFVGVYMKYIWNAFLFVLNVFAPLLYGCIIAYLLTPLMRVFERWLFAKIKHGMIRRGISVILTYIVFVSLLVLLVYAVGPQLVKSLNELQKNLAVYSDSLQSWLDSVSQNSAILASMINAIMQHIDLSILTQPLEQLIQSTYELIKNFSPYIIGFVSSFMIQLRNIFIGLIFAGYILLYKELVFAQIKKLLNAFLKPKTIRIIKSAVKTTDKTFGQYFMGAFLDAIFVGVLTAIALLIFNIPYVPLISVLIACTNIIPIFGPFIGAIPSFIIIFISNPLKALWFVGIILVIQQIDGNIIAPRIYSGTTGIPAIAVTTALIVMGGLFGVFGMIIGVPVFALLGKLINNVTEKRIKAKTVPEPTDEASPITQTNAEGETNGTSDPQQPEDPQIPEATDTTENKDVEDNTTDEETPEVTEIAEENTAKTVEETGGEVQDTVKTVETTENTDSDTVEIAENTAEYFEESETMQQSENTDVTSDNVVKSVSVPEEPAQSNDQKAETTEKKV